MGLQSLLICFFYVCSLLLISPSCEAQSVNRPISIEQNAFQVLEAKCNSCHRKKNRRKIFSLENMNQFAPKIHEQVFVKQRMPKGKATPLTEQEREMLLNWITTLKQH